MTLSELGGVPPFCHINDNNTNMLSNTGYLQYIEKHDTRQPHELLVWRGGITGGGMLDRLGTGGGGAGADRAGMTGGAGVEVVVAGCPAGPTFGLGGMYGVSASSRAAVFGAWFGESEGLTRRGAGAASGRRAGTGMGGVVEFPAARTPTVASGRGAGTGACVLPAGSFPAAASGLGAGIGAGGFPAGIPAGFPGGSTPTGRLAGRGGGGPRLANSGGSAGGKLIGGGIAVVSVSSTSTESRAEFSSK